jgi:dTDP-4-amino-4,6-dideoxygalactose transaminase
MESTIMQVPFVDLAAQRTTIADEIDAALARVLESCDFILGQEVARFEEDFAAYCGTKYAVGVDSGTSALELALRAFGIGAGDEVITVANTFVATVFAITHTGAIPVLVDIDPTTYTIDVTQVEQAITPRTKAIIPVHLYGQPADMDALLAIARNHGLFVIEDACQAHGARYRGQRVGGLGNAAAFSFYPAKNLGACGDAGMIVTDDQETANTLYMLRNYGQSKKYYHEQLGFNRRLDALQAAVLGVKLRYLDQWNALRREHAQLYRDLLSESNVLIPIEANYADAVWHLYVIRAAQRDNLRAYLADNGVSTGIHYPIPIHLQPAYRFLRYNEEDFPIASRYAKQILSLPMYPELTQDMIAYAAQTIERFAETHEMETASSE